jgi:predicted metalloprotease with PDZ domain
VREFDEGGKKHFVVATGDYAAWDGDAATRDLATMVAETHRFWGFLPYEKYVFLLMFRPGGGGLEHRNSTLSTVRANVSESTGRWSSLGLMSHEYFHLFNVKRLRPIELGPFDFEKPPTTGNLWISEGLTSYYGNLMLVRAGLLTADAYLASLSSLIGGLQTSPGRLAQSVEQSSREVWINSNSGINPTATTVSYYNKGAVLGLLLDAKIRRATGGRKSLDDVMRLAYQRYGGERGFTSDQFVATTEEVAGVSLKDWFRRFVSATDELEYVDVLEWYGLRFTAPAGSAQPPWTLEVREDATAPQTRNLQQWLTRSAQP